MKPSFTLFIPQAPPHVRVPELRSEPLQVTMRHMSRWQHRANDTRSPSDSISQIPGVCCTPQHTPRAFSCTCVSCHVGWRHAPCTWSHAARSPRVMPAQVGSRYTARLRQQGITSIRQFSEMAASPAGRAALFSLFKGDDPHNPFNDKKLQATSYAVKDAHNVDASGEWTRDCTQCHDARCAMWYTRYIMCDVMCAPPRCDVQCVRALPTVYNARCKRNVNASVMQRRQ